jgi:hypothetical protein
LTFTNQSILLGGGLNWYRSLVNDADGNINVALNDTPTPAWPEHLVEGKVGYGHGYGTGYANGGAWGYGSPYGCGYGCGGRRLEFVTDELDDGQYAFAVHPVDPAGNENETPTQTDTLALVGDPEPPTRPSAEAADASNITLSWTLSEDDTG